MKNKTFRVTGRTLVVVGSKGKEEYLIQSVGKNGIVIEAQAENGADISELVLWNQIK